MRAYTNTYEKRDVQHLFCVSRSIIISVPEIHSKDWQLIQRNLNTNRNRKQTSKLSWNVGFLKTAYLAVKKPTEIVNGSLLNNDEFIDR